MGDFFKYSVKLCIFVLFVFSVFSCGGVNIQESYFTEQLEIVDNLIFQSQFERASKNLAKIEKKAISPFHCIGIAKRYIKMNKVDCACDFLQKAVKKNSDNEALIAVYVWTLIKTDDIDTAFEYSKRLVTSGYSGLFAQSSFIRYKAQIEEDSGSKDGLDCAVLKDFQKEFLAAYNATGNTVYLQNAAVYECYNGNLAKAYSYHPIKISYKDNAEFWALVSYDSKNYIQAIQDALQIKEADRIRTYVISADSYLRMKELRLAQHMWVKAFELVPHSDPNILMNCAFSCLAEGESEIALKYVKNLVGHFPDFLPGLILYEKYAINDSVPESENSLEKELRKRGLKTIDMIAKDSREKIPISDALYRFEQSYERTNNPEIQIELLKLKWNVEKDISKNQMVVDVWDLLEKYYTNENLKNTKVLNFAIKFFVQQGKFDEAEGLLKTSLNDRFECKNLMNHIDQLSYDECRFFAAIMYHKRLYDDSEKLLSACIKKGKEINDDVYINLANFSQVHGNEKQAIDYYSTVIGKTLNILTKAELNYRIGKIEYQNGDYKNAKLHLDYCLLLNPGHVEGRLLHKKIYLEYK
ncbi:MAG: tetratricopeptide repeat protein [Treponemataceae bacterium]